MEEEEEEEELGILKLVKFVPLLTAQPSAKVSLRQVSSSVLQRSRSANVMMRMRLFFLALARCCWRQFCQVSPPPLRRLHEELRLSEQHFPGGGGSFA